MEHQPLSTLYQKSFAIRKSIITMLQAAGSGHSAGALGMAEAYVSLYFGVLKHDPKNPEWQDRDRVILSNGHTCPVWYATLAEAGYFPKEKLQTLRQLGSDLQGHPHRNVSLGIENTSGPLGLGLSQAVGLALAFKRDATKQTVYCLMSDGEQQEGQNWEAYQSAAKYNLGNLIVLIDNNNIQIDGFTQDVMPLKPLKTKLESFNWDVHQIDGHNIERILQTLRAAQNQVQRPSAIILDTVPGKGVSFMEHDPAWHGKPPSDTEAIAALKELESICGEYWCE